MLAKDALMQVNRCDFLQESRAPEKPADCRSKAAILLRRGGNSGAIVSTIRKDDARACAEICNFRVPKLYPVAFRTDISADMRAAGGRFGFTHSSGIAASVQRPDPGPHRFCIQKGSSDALARHCPPGRHGRHPLRRQ
jgi:hypothetical protein